MEKKLLRRKTLISIFLFVAVFGTMLTLASLYDLEVSKILTDGNIAPGNYYADSQFGRLFEAVGSIPIWLSMAVIGVIVYWNARNYKKLNLDLKINEKAENILQKAVEVIGIAVVIVAFYFLYSDIFKYFLKYAWSYPLKKSPAFVLTCLILGSISSAMFVPLWGKISVEQNKKLILLALVIVVALATRIFIEGIKTPIGRMRYRTMNAIGDFSYYTPWYTINGARTMESGYIPEWEWKDSCKSFPSGHTFAAGMSYIIICLPDFIKKWDNVLGRFLCWVTPICITGIVAISRIMVGAHYFSDVLFGGTIVFLGVMIGREIFISKGKHIKCFMKDKE